LGGEEDVDPPAVVLRRVMLASDPARTRPQEGEGGLKVSLREKPAPAQAYKPSISSLVSSQIEKKISKASKSSKLTPKITHKSTPKGTPKSTPKSTRRSTSKSAPSPAAKPTAIVVRPASPVECAEVEMTSICTQTDPELDLPATPELIPLPLLDYSDKSGDDKGGSHGKHWWLPEEDQALATAVATHGETHWQRVSLLVPGRNGKQCRERWLNHLRPGLKHPGKETDGWSVEEDDLIQEQVQQVGTKWAEIAKMLPGRTDNAIKNRYYAQARKAARQERRTAKKAEAAAAVQISGRVLSIRSDTKTLQSVPLLPPLPPLPPPGTLLSCSDSGSVSTAAVSCCTATHTSVHHPETAVETLANVAANSKPVVEPHHHQLDPFEPSALPSIMNAIAVEAVAVDEMQQQ